MICVSMITELKEKWSWHKICKWMQSSSMHTKYWLGNLIRSFQLFKTNLTMTWMTLALGRHPCTIAFVLPVRSTYHTTLQAMPGQLIFGRDMVLNVQHLANWTMIKTRKQQMIHKIIKLKIQNNSSPLPDRRFSHAWKQYSRPNHITQVNMNWTVHIKINALMDTVTICHIHPFKTPNFNHGGKCNMCRAKDRWA